MVQIVLLKSYDFGMAILFISVIDINKADVSIRGVPRFQISVSDFAASVLSRKVNKVSYSSYFSFATVNIICIFKIKMTKVFESKIEEYEFCN